MTDRIRLCLYLHDDKGRALFLSQDGRHPHWVPKSLVTEPSGVIKLAKINGNSVAQGTYEIERWKVDELGWGESDHPDQLPMNLLEEP